MPKALRLLAATLAFMATAPACGRVTGGADEDSGRLLGPRERDPHTLVVARGADAVGLDPGRVSDVESIEVAEQIFEHLVDIDATGDVVPELAERWEVAPDGRSVTFVLRPGVRFHDGEPVDAAAVVFSFERQLDIRHPAHRPDFAAWRNVFAGLVHRVVAVDARTVRIELFRTYAPLLGALALSAVAIVSPKAVLTDVDGFTRRPVGTGPFRFAEWVPGERIVLARNPAYWGRAPKLARVVFRVVPDARQRLVALEGGSVDVAYGLLPAELQFVALHPDLVLVRSPGVNVAYLAMNTQRAPWTSVAVRRAVSHAINKAALVNLSFQGTAQLARGPVPPSLWGAADDLPTFDYDPDEARSLLAGVRAAGLLPERRYTLYAPTTPRRYLPEPVRVARAIQGNLEAVGLHVDLVLGDLATHLAAVQGGEHDLCLLGWTADFPDPDNFLSLLFSSESAERGLARNVAFYLDAEVSGLLQLGQEAGERAERAQHYREAQRRIALDAPWVPLAHAEVIVAARDEVRGMVILPTSVISFVDVEIVTGGSH